MGRGTTFMLRKWRWNALSSDILIINNVIMSTISQILRMELEDETSFQHNDEDEGEVQYL